MTVDASRSCLGLGTCVGSTIRQIVEARVLLTATVPPTLPGKSMSDGLLAPPVNGITRFLRSAWCYCHLPSDGPDETREFAGDRGGDDIGGLSGAGELAITGTQPHLALPGDVADRLGLVLLSQQHFAADPGGKAVAPGCLNQEPAGRSVSGLG